MVGYLGTGTYHEAIIFIPVRDDNMVLDGSLLHLGNDIFSLDNQIGLGKTAFHVAHFCMKVRCEVARGIMDAVRLRLRMQAWRAGVHSPAGVKQRGQNFIIDLNKLQGLLGDFRRLGSQGCDTITDKAHPIIEAVLVMRAGFGPGLPGGRIGYTRHVFIGQYGMHAGQCSRLRNIDVAYNRMRMWTREQSRMQHAAQFNVIDKGGLACNQFDCIHFTFSFADNVQFSGNTRINERCRPAFRGIFLACGMVFAFTEAGETTVIIVSACTILSMFQWRTARIPGAEVLIRARAADRRHCFAAHDGRCPQHSLHRFDIAGTAAEVARKRITYLTFGRARIAFKQRVGGEQHTWRAESTLDSARVNEGFLYGMQFTGSAKAFNGGQRAAANLDSQGNTAWTWYAIDQHGTGTAFTCLTTMLDAIIAFSAQRGH